MNARRHCRAAGIGRRPRVPSARALCVLRALALYLGHTIAATPLVIILVRAGLRTTDLATERAARSLGASAWRARWHVTLPAIRETIIGGAIFSFLVSFDEVVIAIFVGGRGATTLPKQMWESIRFGIDPTLTAIASMLTLLAITYH